MRPAIDLDILLGGRIFEGMSTYDDVTEEDVKMWATIGPNCGTFDAPVCLVDLTPPVPNDRGTMFKRICGRLLPCETHRGQR